MNGSLLYRTDVSYSNFDEDCFLPDLHLDRIIDDITSKRAKGKIRGYFYQKPKKPDDVLFRLSVMKELERLDIRDIVQEFAMNYGAYKTCREYSQTLSQRLTKQKWLLDAAYAYCGSVIGLKERMSGVKLESEGLLRFLRCLEEYTNADEFVSLQRDMEICSERIDSIQYTIDINLDQNKIRIMKGGKETTDCCEKLAETFSQYQLAKNPKIVAFPGVNMETLELSILDTLGDLYQNEFGMLDDFYARHSSFGSGFLDAFETELQFFLSYIEYMDRIKEKGLPFSYPVFLERKEMRIRDGYDLSLSDNEHGLIACNDFDRAAGENFVITGPNQGGKTTYARMIGQIQYFVSLGLPAPCKSVETCFLERIHTHFAREEDLSTNFGRLKEELQRIKKILDTIPRDSMIIFNDLFASTTTYDALQMGKRVLGSFIRQDCLCLFVTHIHELAEADPSVVSLYAAMDDDQRIYKVMRGNRLSKPYMNYLIEEERLNYNDIRSRVK